MYIILKKIYVRFIDIRLEYTILCKNTQYYENWNIIFYMLILHLVYLVFKLIEVKIKKVSQNTYT